MNAPSRALTPTLYDMPWQAFLKIIPLLFLSIPLLPFLGRRIRNYFLNKETITFDLPVLGKSRQQGEKIRGTAVVCGGSIAGLLTARVCSDHFEKVIIVEPEAWLCTEDGKRIDSWNQKNKRTRVMQYYSIHGNLVPVTQCLLRLFPDFEEESSRSGIRLPPADFKVFPGGHQILCPYDEYNGTLPQGAQAGRRATETLIRRLTLDNKRYPNISQIPGSAIGVEVDPAKPKYLKRVIIQNSETGLKEYLDATLVIDCTGPARAGMKHLPQAGFGKLLEDLTASYDPQMRYATFNYKFSQEFFTKLPEETKVAPGLFVYKGDPKHSQGIVAATKLEGDYVSLTCGSWGVPDLPEDLDSVRKYLASTKPTKAIPEWIWQFIDMCQQVEDTLEFSKVRAPPSFWTHYELANDLPPNWIALGDSVSRVNPVYGQGGCKAMMGIASLNTLLHDLNNKKVYSIPTDFSRNFFCTQAEKIKPIWMGNKMIDYAYKTTVPEKGETLEVGSYIRWYLGQVENLSVKDKQIGSVVWHGLHAIGASIDVMNPIIVGKVLLHLLTTSTLKR
ncbi:hypothetical protein VKT23_001425 [Stygiomarasmius scandens]|uniref:Uncharacterized protein n=1 Tax=Marasmiellus scandens TaxID=2682957 RepID=A0ABR1K1J4_9AGAR